MQVPPPPPPPPPPLPGSFEDEDAAARQRLEAIPFMTQPIETSRKVLADAVQAHFEHLRAMGRVRLVHSDEAMAEGLVNDPSQVNHFFDKLELPKLITRLNTLWLRRLGSGKLLQSKIEKWKRKVAALLLKDAPEQNQVGAAVVASEKNHALVVAKRDIAVASTSKPTLNPSTTTGEEQARQITLAQIHFELALGQVMQSKARAFTTHDQLPTVYLRVPAPTRGAGGHVTSIQPVSLTHDLVHEICHVLSAPNGGCTHPLFQRSMAFDEGLTEYFAEEVCQVLGVSDGVATALVSYERQTDFIRWLCRGGSGGGGFAGLEQQLYAAKFGKMSSANLDGVVEVLGRHLRVQVETAQKAAVQLAPLFASVGVAVDEEQQRDTVSKRVACCLQFEAACGLDSNSAAGCREALQVFSHQRRSGFGLAHAQRFSKPLPEATRVPPAVLHFGIVRQPFEAARSYRESKTQQTPSKPKRVANDRRGRKQPQNQFNAMAQKLKASLLATSSLRKKLYERELALAGKQAGGDTQQSEMERTLYALQAAKPPDLEACRAAGDKWLRQLAHAAGIHL